MFLNTLTKFVRLGEQFIVGEPLHLRLEGIDSLDPGHHALDDPLVFGPEDLAYQSVDQTLKSFRGDALSSSYAF
jgi:hypothetical protein